MKKILLILLFFILGCPQISAQKLGQDRFDFSSKPDEMTLSEYATIYYGENNTDDAMAAILKIKEYERSAQDWLILGNILQDKGKVADAAFMYNKAILTDKKYYKAYYNLANIYFDENKLNMAITNYKLASKYNDKFPYAYYNMGCAYLELGQIKKAKYAFLKAVELKNTIPEFHYNLAFVYKKLGKEKLSKQYLDNYNNLMLGQ
ncbi:tetratricopeptide repeat protein [bacterium]|nr:tetratricopeptide repeat protein [bacterium]